MKAKIHALLLAAGCAVVPQAQAGWFDWFTPGEWFEGTFEGVDGLYTGGGLEITKATGQLNRRLGGERDFGGQTLLIDEPGFITTAMFRGGWAPIEYLAVEAQAGFALDSDKIENGSNSQRFSMDPIYGVYLRPQINLGDSFTLYARAGFTSFSFQVECFSDFSSVGNSGDPTADQPTGCRDENGATLTDENNNTVRELEFSDSGFSWGGGVQLRLSSQTRLAFNYTQHFDEDDAKVFAVGVTMSYLFGEGSGGGGDDEDDEYY